MIQVHRARIAHLLRTRRHSRGSEVADLMNAIAVLCDRGRTERGRALAQRLAQTERAATEPIVAKLTIGEPVELARPGASNPS